MEQQQIEHDVTLWMANDVPARMVYGGQRWRITDTPTRLRDSIWSSPVDQPVGLYGWRFQATSDSGATYVFDVFRDGVDSWHVHRAYA